MSIRLLANEVASRADRSSAAMWMASSCQAVRLSGKLSRDIWLRSSQSPAAERTEQAAAVLDAASAAFAGRPDMPAAFYCRTSAAEHFSCSTCASLASLLTTSLARTANYLACSNQFFRPAGQFSSNVSRSCKTPTSDRSVWSAKSLYCASSSSASSCRAVSKRSASDWLDR